MDAGHNGDLGGQGAYLVHGASVHPLAGQEPLLYNHFLDAVEDFLHILHHVGMVFRIFILYGGDPFVHPGFPDVFVVRVHAEGHAFHVVGADLLKKRVVKGGVVVRELGLADFLNHLVDEIQHRLKLFVGLDNTLVHDVVGNFVGGSLDHDDLFVRGGDGDSHAVGFPLGLGGIKEKILSVPAQGNAGDGAVKRDVGYGYRGGGADHGGDFRRAIPVDAEDFADNGHVVAQVRGEQRAHGPVDQAAGQHGGKRRTALPAHEAAGDAADGVKLFIEVHGQGEIVDAVPGTGRGGGGGQNGGLTVLDQHGGVGKLGHAAHLKAEGAAAVVQFIDLFVQKFFLFNDH